MGTTTFYLKHNDFGLSLNQMSKDDSEALSQLSPFGDNNRYKWGTTHLELKKTKNGT